MKRLLVVLAFVFSGTCQSQEISAEKINWCNQQSMLVTMAAEYRDSRQSPQEFMALVSRDRSIFKLLTDQQIKRFVNLVYFDGSFVGVPSQALGQAVSNECLYPAPHYQPLQ